MFNVPNTLTETGVYIVGVVAFPGKIEVDPKGLYPDKFKLRIATGGDQTHVPFFCTVSFDQEYTKEADKIPYLKKELAGVVIHGRLTNRVGKDGKTVWTELHADGVRELTH